MTALSSYLHLRFVLEFIRSFARAFTIAKRAFNGKLTFFLKHFPHVFHRRCNFFYTIFLDRKYKMLINIRYEIIIWKMLRQINEAY